MTIRAAFVAGVIIHVTLVGIVKASEGLVTVNQKDSTYSISAADVPLGKALAELASRSGRAIVIQGECRSPITVSLSGVLFENVLKALLTGSTFTVVVRDGVYIVAQQNVDTLLYQDLIAAALLRRPQDSTRAFLPDLINKIPIPLTNNDMISDALVPLRHIRASEAVAALPVTLVQSHLTIDKERNALLVTGTAQDLDRIRNTIAAIDTPRPQINIDVLFVEYSEDASTGTGLEFGSGGGASANHGLQFPATEYGQVGDKAKNVVKGILTSKISDFLGDDFYLRLRLLVQEGKANVLAKPSISVINGHMASVSVDETAYYKTTTAGASSLGTTNEIRIQPVRFGISLSILPTVTQGNTITAEIEPEISTSSGINSDGLPSVFTRRIQTSVQIEDGKTLILGGLVKQVEETSIKKVPFLGDIPVLGLLFQVRDKQFVRRNLCIYITPHIISADSGVSTNQIEEKLKSTKYQRLQQDMINK
jgi:type II secretory pathway component GspD/PulD (secretin)